MAELLVEFLVLTYLGQKNSSVALLSPSPTIAEYAQTHMLQITVELNFEALMIIRDFQYLY